MKNFLPALLFMLGFIGCSSSDEEPENVVDITYTPTEISAEYENTASLLNVTSEREWTLYSNDSWITCEKHPSSSSTDYSGNATITIAANTSTSERTGTVVIKSGSTRVSVPVKQAGKPETPVDPNIPVPDGYKLVWQDEFTDASLSMPDESLWWYEVWGPGYVNNELQRYVKGKQGNDVTAEVSNGTLKIHAKKAGNEVISARVNTIASWKYGYFEARLKLPKGKGTWPAFWMMPKQEGTWPDCGEIDIMEEVGYNPNYVSSSIHCKAYNHTIGTQKTKETLISTAQTEFHVYALEWTEDFIQTYVDGKELFYFANDKKGDKNTWPFNAAFYLKLNLAWGGDWGGAQGVDESALPATYEIDYVRVFQKN
ncbi:MAG: family 16 glycosylhydrolase [Breznakibacter sp.]